MPGRVGQFHLTFDTQGGEVVVPPPWPRRDRLNLHYSSETISFVAIASSSRHKSSAVLSCAHR